MAICKGCKAEIFFIATPKGKSAPIDAKPRNFYFQESHGAWVLLKGHEPHFATCPTAAQFKKKKGGRG